MAPLAERTRPVAAPSPWAAADLLERWCDDRRPAPRVLVFAAHPDDDVIGLGGQLHRVAAETHVAIVTDGAPDAPDYYRSLGFERRVEYAAARHAEAASALSLAGVPERHLHELALVDQTVARRLDVLIEHVHALISSLRPELIITHPYEGGHPDHDATACGVHVALHELRQRGAPCPALLELASYHVRGPVLVHGEHIFDPSVPARFIELDASARRRKLELLECHASQRHVWQVFPLEREHFRVAPRYDFRAPPAAPFFYDRVDWGTSGRELLRLFQRCLDHRGIGGSC
jgi:N-acetylglucosamine malate deacetylase 2